MLLAISCWTFVRVFAGASATVALENIALRHQLVVLQRSVSRPRFRRWDRAFWVCLSRLWRPWRSSLLIVQPATVVAWHRKGLRLYWRWRSRSAPIGRPLLDPQVRTLIRRMACENPTWGRRRIQAELHLLGYDVAELTVAKYMRRRSPAPSPTWRAFLEAHLREIIAIDFFVVPSLTFRLLFAFIVLRHDRRELVHVNVTDHPTAAWAAQPGSHRAPCAVAKSLRRTVIGSIRRECLNHFIVLNERHLRRLLRAYLVYYNTTRPHQALGNNSPLPREVQPPAHGRIIAFPEVGGVHHRYQRAA